MAEKNREIKKSSAQLPEPIIQHILSFLPEKDVTKTCILSKAWLSAWRTKPNLEFDSELFLRKKEWKISNMGSEEKEKKRKTFFKYIKRTLKRYTQQKMSIETLKLDYHIYGDYSPVDSDSVLVQGCTRVAVERGVKKLHLSADCELPQIIVGAKSLVDLSLEGFNMLHLSTQKIMWHSLKQLCLSFIYIDEAMLKNIISSCPLLEILEISYAADNDDNDFDKELKFKVIIEHHNLKELTVRLYPRHRLVLAEAPKLESLICINDQGEFLGVRMIPSGLSLHSSQYQNLKMLRMCGVSITDKFFNNLEQNFPRLQDLSVLYCQNLRRIKISSQTLQRIELMENYKLKEAHFDVPSIQLLEYICNTICRIIPEFSFTSTKGPWISRIYWRRNMNSCWFLQLKKLLVNLIPSDIFLDIAIYESIELDINEIRNSSTFGEPPEVQELSLRLPPFLDSSYSSSVRSALDCFFSICRPNSISQYPGTEKNDKFVKLLYDMLMFRTNLPDEQHKLQQMKSWQHDLRQVKVQIYECNISFREGKIEYLRDRLAYHQPKALDWKSILKALRSRRIMDRMIYFMLNWKKHSMSKKEKKRDRRSHKKQKIN